MSTYFDHDRQIHTDFDTGKRISTPDPTLERARERLANTYRLAAMKGLDEDRAGWLEDAAHWEEIVKRLERT